MMRWGMAVTLMVCAVLARPELAEGDEAAVRAAFAAYLEAFNRQDADAVANLWSEGAVHVSRATGERLEGRAAIRADLEAVFKSRPKTRLAGAVERFRLIRPDVAQVEGQVVVESPDEGAETTKFSAIVVKQGEQWQLDSVEESPLPTPPSAAEALKEG